MTRPTSRRTSNGNLRPQRSCWFPPCYLHERERDVDHPLEVRDRDPLVGRVDVRHPVREVQTLQASLVEDVCGGETHRLVVSLEAIASGARIDRGLDVAVTDL